LPAFGVSAVSFTLGHDRSAVAEAAERACQRAAQSGGRVCLIIVETPANPTNSLVDLELMREFQCRSAGGRAADVRRGGRQHVLGPYFSVRSALARPRDVFSDEIRRWTLGFGRGGVVGSREAVGPVKKCAARSAPS